MAARASSEQRDVVLRRVEDGVAVLSLNRPDRHNAINDALAQELHGAVGWAIAEREVRSILLRGEGKSFSSGRDTSQLGQRPGGESDFEFVRRAQERALTLLESPKPVVAALKGYVLGGAFEVALRADVRIAAPDVQLGFPELLYGIIPDTGGTQMLASLIGPSRAKYYVMTGERLGAEQALAWGVVNEVVPAEQLDERTLSVAKKLAAAPPLAMTFVKRLIDLQWADQIRRGMQEELTAQTELFASEDYREARAARREGREPTFEGR